MTGTVIIILVVFAAVTTAVVAVYVHTGRAIGRSMAGLMSTMSAVADSVKFSEEKTDQWWPVLWNGDTVAKVIAIGHAQYGSSTAHSILIYRALLTGRAPAYQPESLAAIDSSDDARFAHELRLVPRRAVPDSDRTWLGTLSFEHVHEGIPVMSRFEAPHPIPDRSAAVKAMLSH